MKGLLFVGLLGYAIGTLCAPKKGSELRQEMKDLICDLQETGSDAMLDVQSKASELLDKAQPALDQVKESAQTIRRNATNSFNEAFAKEQSAAKNRKMKESKYFEPSSASAGTARTL